MAETPELLLLAAAIVVLGMAAKLVADRYSVPSVVFLLSVGLVFGPSGLGFIDPDLLGQRGLSTVVSLSVAIIVFEGGFHLTKDKLTQSRGATLWLTTVGAAITLVGAGAGIHYLLDVPWDLSLLISSLLVATGPTVITPVVSQIDVRDSVAGVLESEGVINDVMAAILAIVMFEAAVLGDASPRRIVEIFMTKVGVGVIVGVVAAGLTWYVLRSLRASAQNSRLMILGTAILSFSVADLITTEAGIAAVAVAGVALGNLDIPHKSDIAAFKGDVTFIVLSIVFILLAALIEPGGILALGAMGAVLVLYIMLVVRPLGVLLATIRSKFSMGERLFIASVGPRGIVPASIATLFAIQLRADPTIAPRNADMVANVVFLVIAVTVVVQAGGAPFIARKLDIRPMNVLIVGGGRVGKDIAETLTERGENVVVVERDPEVVEDLAGVDFKVIRGNGTSAEVLEDAGIDRAKVLVAAAGDDDQNILACQTAKTKFGVQNVIARVNTVENVEAFEDLGVQTVSPARATSFAVDNMIERPGLFTWMSELGQGGDVVEIDVTNEALAGANVDDLDLPEGCLIALLQRDSEQFVPGPDVSLELGDRVTLLGRTDAVDEAVERLH
jgi:NhaP-type Na+/H+ or K+/H+ antiporter